jgi:hypothetical protein
MAEDIKSLYPYVPKGTFKDETEFVAFASDPNNRRDVFSIIKSKGVFSDESDFNTFMDSLKKKESTQLGSGDGASVLPSKSNKPSTPETTNEAKYRVEKTVGTKSFSEMIGEGFAKNRPLTERDVLKKETAPPIVEKTIKVSKDKVFGLPTYTEETKVTKPEREKLSPTIEEFAGTGVVTPNAKWSEILPLALQTATESLVSPAFKTIGIMQNDLNNRLILSGYGDALGLEFSKVKDYSAYKLGQHLDLWSELLLPVSDQTKESLAGQLTAGGTSLAGYALLSGIGTATGTGAILLPAIAGAMQNGTSEYERAYKETTDATDLSDNEYLIKYGAGKDYNEVLAQKQRLSQMSPDAVAFDNWMGASAIGTLEALPVANWAKRFNIATGGVFSKVMSSKIKDIATSSGAEKAMLGAFEEGTEEALTQLLTNANAISVYDKTRDIWEGVAENAGVGAILGFTLNGLTHVVQKKLQQPGNTPKDQAILEKTLDYLKEQESLIKDVKSDELVKAKNDIPEVQKLKEQKMALEMDYADTKVDPALKPDIKVKIDEIDNKITDAKIKDQDDAVVNMDKYGDRVAVESDIKNLEKQKEILTPESTAIVDQKIAEATSLLESLKAPEPIAKLKEEDKAIAKIEDESLADKLRRLPNVDVTEAGTGTIYITNKNTNKRVRVSDHEPNFGAPRSTEYTEIYTKDVSGKEINKPHEIIEKVSEVLSTPIESDLKAYVKESNKQQVELNKKAEQVKTENEAYQQDLAKKKESQIPFIEKNINELNKIKDEAIAYGDEGSDSSKRNKRRRNYFKNAVKEKFNIELEYSDFNELKDKITTKKSEVKAVVEKPTVEAKPLASGDQVQLEPQIQGGLPRVMEFKNGTWQQKVGNEYTTVSKEAQQEAQNLYDSQNKQGVSGKVGIRQEPIQTKPIERGGKEAPSPSGDVQTSQKVKESGEFVVQGTFNGHQVIAGNKQFEVADYRQIGQQGKTELVENTKGDKKIFTLVTPNTDAFGRRGYMGVSLVLPNTTTKTKAEIESILKSKVAEVKANLNKNAPGVFNKAVNMKYEGETLALVAKETKATPPPIPKTAVKEKTVTPPPIPKEVTPPVKETEALTPIPEIKYENLSYTAAKKGDLDLKYQDDSKKDFWKSDGQMPPRSSMPKQMTNEDYDTLTWMFVSLNTQRFIWNYLHTNPDVSFNQVYIDTTNAFLPDGKKIPYVDTPTAKKLLSEYTKSVATPKEEAAQPAKKEAEAPKTFVREEYSPVTKKDISIPKFTKDEAIDYEEDSKEGDNGRSYTYLSLVKVPVTNDVTGDDIGALAKVKDEDGNISWRADDADGFELSDEDFDTKDEAIEAILKKHNKDAEKEHNKEQNRLAKKFEKEAAKEATKKAKVKPEAKGKDRFMVAINKNLPADQAAEVESIINDALNDINATTSEVVNIEKTIPQDVPMTPIVVSKDDARSEANLMRDLSVPLDMIYGKTVGIGMSDTLTTGERTVPVYNTETGKVSDQKIREEGGIGYPFKSLLDYINGKTKNISDVFGWAAVNINAASGMINAAKKADKITGKELKAHYFKSLGLNKAKLSAEQQAQKQRLEDGIPDKKEYGLVTIYKMGDDGIKSNEAYTREAFRQIEVTLNDAEKAEFFEKAKQRLEQVKWEGKEEYIDKLKTAKNFKEFEDMLHGPSSDLNLRSKADIISRVFLSTESTESKEDKNPVGYLLKSKGISLESVAKAIEEPAMDGVLPGQMMLLLAIDPDAQTIVDTERKRHKNYPAGVVGLPVGLFEETAMFHNLSPQMMDTFVKSSTSDRDSFATKKDPETGKQSTVTVVVSQNLDGTYKAEEFGTEIKQVPVKDTLKTVSAKAKGKEGEKRVILDKKGNPVTANSKEDMIKKLKNLGYQFSKGGLKAPYRPNISGATFNDLIQKAKSATLNIFDKPQLSPQQKLVKYLQAAFPGIVVEMSAQEAEASKSMYTDQKLFTKSSDARPYGFIREGRVYLDPTYLNNNTPIHEFGHIWTSFAKNYRSDIYAKGVDLIKNSSYYKDVLDSLDYRKIVTGIFGEDAIIKTPNGEYIANPQSASYADVKDYIYDEALSTAIGDKGEMFVNQAQKSAFSRWLELLFSAVKKITGFESFTDEEFKNITLNQFVDAAVKELLGGKKISAIKSKDIAKLDATEKFLFAGEKGIQRLEAANEVETKLNFLDIAKRMRSEGMSAKDIKVRTGWEMGADKKWRYELPETKINFDVTDLLNAEVNGYYYVSASNDFVRKPKFDEVIGEDKNGIKVKLSDTEGAIVYPMEQFIGKGSEFEKAYPELMSIKVYVATPGSKLSNAAGPGTIGYFDRFNNRIVLNSEAFKSVEDMRSTFFHEVQHAIQIEEGFALGASPMGFEVDEKAAAEAERDLTILMDLYDNNTIARVVINTFPKFGGASNADYDNYVNNTAIKNNIKPLTFLHAITEVTKLIGDYPTRSNYDAAIKRFRSIMKDNDAFALYKRAAGEVESRNVQTRMDMSPLKRRASLMEDTADVAKEDRIFLFDQAEQAYSASATQKETTKAPVTNVEKTFSKATDLFYKIKGTEGAAKRKALADERKALMNENPSVKFIDDNIKNVLDQLEAKEVATRKGNCP